ncbi:asparagine synthetase B family protein [Thermodesulfobacteriota bacterium]
MTQGIFGIIDFNRSIDNQEHLAETMSTFFRQDTLEKSKVTLEIGPHHILGMKRTGIDPYQQITIAKSADSKTFCLIHGEYHNFNDLSQQLSNGDLDLALELYKQKGFQFAKNLNGLFCMAILDEQEKSLFLFNDRFGMAHQVYWTIVDGRLCFATHLKTLLAYPGIERELDYEGLNLFLKYSYIPSPWTIFKGIRKLPPGHALVFRDGMVDVNSYWEFKEPEHTSEDLQQAVSSYKKLLKESISRRVLTNDDVGILLSGGLDSSANVALAAQCTEKRLKTFSIGFEDEAFDERPYARIVANKYDTEHFEYIITGDEIEDLPKLIWNLEEPYFEFGFFLTYLGLASAQKEVKIILGGEGADQMFGTGGFVGGRPVALRQLLLKSYLLKPATGIRQMLKGRYFYDNDNLAFKLRLLLGRITDLNDWYFYGYDGYELNQLHNDPALAVLPDIFNEQSSGKTSSFEELYCETQINQDLKHYVNENVMVKSGRMADMLGLTLRESYLDIRVADFLTSLDYNLKRKGDLIDHLKGNFKTKFLHRKAMEGLLPTDIMSKPKQGGFVPVMIFLKDKQLRQRIYHHLLNSEIIKELFNNKYISDIFQNYESLQGKDIYWHNFYNSKANRILFLLTFEIWHHFYIENNALEINPPPLSKYLL